jgi:hypothetical protein
MLDRKYRSRARVALEAAESVRDEECPPAPYVERVSRPCLRCDRKFMSRSAVNRLCPTCIKRIDNYSDDEESYFKRR